MKGFLVFCGLFLSPFFYANCQDSTYSFPQVGWTIKISKDFKVLDSVKNVKYVKKGNRITEKSTDTIIDNSEIQSLITATIGKFGMINSTISPQKYNDSIRKIQLQKLKDISYEMDSKLIKRATFDSSSSIIFIDSLPFDRFQINSYRKNKVVFSTVFLFTNQNGYDFSISYTYTDDEMRATIESTLFNSTFNKQ